MTSPIVSPDNLWRSWNFDPVMMAGIAVLACAYVIGLSRLWSKGRGRGVTVLQSAAFAGGMGALVVALVSPLDQLAESLFSAHMVQHLLLMLVAAPLLVAGSAGTVIGLGLPLVARRTVRGWERRPPVRALSALLTRPVVVLVLQIGVLFLWHLPVLYQDALRSDAVHALEHGCFFGTAWLFWWLILDDKGRRKLGNAPAVLFVFLAGLASGALGALLTFAPSALYPLQALGARAWGISPLQDQQLAGLIMWVPAGVIYLLTAAALFLRWLAEAETAVAREGGMAG